MPMFDFRCQDCGHVFEELVSNSAAPPPCPKCESTKTLRMLSKFSVKTGGGGGSTSSYSPPKSNCTSFG